MGKREKKRMVVFLFELLILAVAVGIGSRITHKEKISATSARAFGQLTAPVRQVREPLEGEKIAYLTFDDGPSANTEVILNLLKEYGAKATFFVVGEGVTEENRSLLERMRKEGHSIGLHAYRHVYEELYASTETLLADYEKLSQVLKEEFGISSSLYRFPGGSVCTYLKANRQVCLEEMKIRGYACFDWHVSGEDAVGDPTPQKIQQEVFQRVFHYKNPIILLHDGKGQKATTEALRGILEGLRKEGYRFESLEHAPEYVYRR